MTLSETVPAIFILTEIFLRAEVSTKLVITHLNVIGKGKGGALILGNKKKRL